MANRIIKESICTSDTLAQVSAEAERLFWRIVVQADDFGRFEARPEVIRGQCLTALMDEVTNEDVQGWLAELQYAGLLRLYRSDGKAYLQLVTWDKHQRRRAQYSKYPQPPEDDDGRGQLTADVVNGQQMSADVGLIRGTRNEERGTKEKHTVSADAQTGSDPAPPRTRKPRKQDGYSADFVAFWSAYPKKINKRGAYRCWRARLKERLESGDPITPAMLITAGRAYAARCVSLHTEPQFIKHPSTFLSRDHVFAEYLAPVTPPETSPPEPPLDDIPMSEYIRRAQERRRASQ